ncbi:LOW QUALITY PROTEIN: T-cell surface protein tactile [Cottoperca gobio]|uniref:LOW QUALITY PROTEIN: T-cell surface protein tactile n=1 Tax=Cottoperca gobio TaxID=56716 RepID=A0A6J2R4F8_COTGO|nr:LOW QUALITY PROTEIN: T-cell surface protein tactile [Cottoperca gobio]
MSLGTSNMAGCALGTAFSLLLLVSIIQGLQDVEVFHHEKLEAVVGQNVTLPCIIKGRNDLKITSIEWRKNKHGNTKLAVHSTEYGFNLLWPNVTMEVENTSMGSYLNLYGVSKWESGVYICDISSFPLGIIRRETKLEIKDDPKILCDMDRIVNVHSGENVTIQCKAFPDAQYKWTKNKTLVSENESLELWGVTDAHSGVYTLTVNTGNTSLHKEFIITVLTATTSLRTDLLTIPQSTVTEEGVIEDRGFTTSPTTGLSTVDSNVTWTMNMATDVTDDNPNSRNVTAVEQMTSLTNSTHISVTSSPVTHTDHYPANSSTDQEINPTHNLNTSKFFDQTVPVNPSTTLSYVNKAFRSTQETRNESLGGNPGATPTLSPGSTTIVIEGGVSGGVRSRLLLPLIIAPILLLIAVVGFLYRRKMIKESMDQPPPFKPPPPPVKYTAARHHEISTQPFPTSRCNSVIELKDMKQKCISV